MTPDYGNLTGEFINAATSGGGNLAHQFMQSAVGACQVASRTTSQPASSNASNANQNNLPLASAQLGLNMTEEEMVAAAIRESTSGDTPLIDISDAEIQDAKIESLRSKRNTSHSSKVIEIINIDDDNGGGKIPAQAAQFRSVSPVPSGSARVIVQRRANSVSPRPPRRPSGPTIIFRRMEASNVRDMFIHKSKADLTADEKKKKKAAKKRKSLFEAEEAGGRVETVGRQHCQAVGIPFSQMSDYADGKEVNGKVFKSPEANVFFDHMHETDSD